MCHVVLVFLDRFGGRTESLFLYSVYNDFSGEYCTPEFRSEDTSRLVPDMGRLGAKVG